MLDVRLGTAAALRLATPERWTGATAMVLAPSGSVQEEPVPVLDTVSTAVSGTPVARDAFEVASGTGIERGRKYSMTLAAQGEVIVEVANIDSTTVTLVEPLPSIPAALDTFLGLEWAVAVAASSNENLGRGYRVIIRDIGSNPEVMAPYNVVRHPFQNPVTTLMVRRFGADHWPGDKLFKSEEKIENIRDDAGLVIRTRLQSQAVYPEMFWDPDTFYEAGMAAIELVLARKNRVPAAADPLEHKRSLQTDLSSRLGEIIRSLEPRDADGDDAADATPAAFVAAIELVR